MDINENLQQTNTFGGGMDTDTSDMLMQPERYRFAKNLRIITDSNSNSGELHMIEGSDKYYLYSDEELTEEFDLTNFIILKATLIRDYGIIIAKYKYLNYWSIFTIHNHIVKKIFGDCSDLLGDNISVVARYETDDVIKLYIADGVHALMSINILEDNNPVPSDINYLTTVKQYNLTQPSITDGTSGTFSPGMVQYAYRLYNKYGSQTNISPLSNMHNVAVSSDMGEGNTKTVKYSANITIRERINELYKKIKVYRILYTQIGQDPIISLIVDDDLKETDFVFEDLGIDITKLSVDEFLGDDNYYIIPNEIESKNDYLFAGNVLDYIKKNQSIYLKLKADIKQGRFKLNTSLQLSNLSFNSDYDAGAWFTATGQQSASQWKQPNSDCYLKWNAYTGNDIYGNTYMNDEIYRFGIVLYDKNGVTWPAIWIFDLRTPVLYNQYLTTRGVKYKFKVEDNFIDEYGDFFTGYEIVRCNRTWKDKHVLTLGIASRALLSYNYNLGTHEGTAEEDISKPNKYLTSSGFMTFTDVVVYSKPSYTNEGSASHWGMGEDENCREFSAASNNYLIFSSPEVCYQPDDIANAMKTYNNSLQFVTRYYRNIDFNSDRFNLFCNFGNTGIGFFTHRMFQEWVSTVIGVGAPLYVDFSSVSSDSENLGWNYDSYQGHRCALWFPIFTYKRLTPQYRNNFGDDRGKTLDEEHNWIYPIKNLLYATGDIIQPVNQKNVPIGNYSGNITSFSNITVPTFDLFMSGDSVAFRDNSTIINDKELLGWSVPGYAGYTRMDQIKEKYSDKEEMNCERNWRDSETYSTWYRIPTLSINFPVSEIGAGFILQTDADMQNQYLEVPEGHIKTDKLSTSDYSDNYGWRYGTNDEISGKLNYYPGLDEGYSFTLPAGYASVPIVDIINTNVIPYGGFSEYARNNSTYQSFGCYSKIRSGNEVAVPGDCFWNTFEYNSAKTWYDPKVKYAPHMTTIYKVPVMSSINMNLDHGDKASRVDNDYRIQDTPSDVRGYIQDRPAYAYNTAYSNQDSVKFFTGSDYEDDTTNCDVRIYNSSPKTNGETIDKWLQFKAANFLDVDSRYGEITNLKLFKDTLVYNQECASGVLSVNERTMVEDTNGENIILGNGPIMQRYDYISTVYGMHKKDHACGNSDTTLYWWDRNNKELLMYNKNGFAPMKSTKNVKTYIDTQDISQSKPIVVYDNKYSEMLFGIGNKKLLAYSEITQRFTSEYDLLAENVIYLPSQVILSSDDLYEWNVTSNTSTLKPHIKYVVNKSPMYNKVFDNIYFGGRVYGGEHPAIDKLTFNFETPLKQSSYTTGKDLTNFEYDYRMSIPRDNNAEVGGRMRGKTMECTIESNDTSKDFSLQYITTKFRMSWA